jgi:hypothetical protein
MGLAVGAEPHLLGKCLSIERQSLFSGGSEQIDDFRQLRCGRFEKLGSRHARLLAQGALAAVLLRLRSSFPSRGVFTFDVACL